MSCCMLAIPPSLGPTRTTVEWKLKPTPAVEDSNTKEPSKKRLLLKCHESLLWVIYGYIWLYIPSPSMVVRWSKQCCCSLPIFLVNSQLFPWIVKATCWCSVIEVNLDKFLKRSDEHQTPQLASHKSRQINRRNKTRTI